MNMGERPTPSASGLLTTLGYKIGGQKAVYALEGSIAIAGALVQWLRDNLGLIQHAPDVETLARSVEDSGGIYFVPAFSGLYAPHWRADARGVIVGLTRFITKGHIARAALEATAYQTREVLDAMEKDSGVRLKALKVDGGMVRNELLMQFQADILDVPVIRPKVAETTALGAAYAAGLAVGFWKDFEELRSHWGMDKEWKPQMAAAERDRLYAGWKKAVNRTLDWASPPTPAPLPLSCDNRRRGGRGRGMEVRKDGAMKTSIILPFLTLAALLSAGLTIIGYYLRPPRRTLIYICKPLTTILIFLIAIIPGSFLKDGYPFAIGIGLLFSLLGDIWEMLSRRHFFKALICFLITHICYALAFLGSTPAGVVLWPGIPLTLIGASILTYLWGALSPGMKTAVGVYVGVIVIMVSLAAGRALAHPTIGTLLAAIGALLFLVSDGLLAVNRFRRPFRAAQAVILGTYFIGQGLIALSVGFPAD